MKMKKFEYSTHTVWEIRRWTKEKSGICLIKETGNRKKIKTILQNPRFHYHKGQKQWFATIRLPFFYFMKDNCNVHIGFPNRYIWVTL